MKELSKTGDFNDTINYYLELLKFMNGAKPNVIKDSSSITSETIGRLGYNIAIVRAMCNSVSLAVGQMEELTPASESNSFFEIFGNPIFMENIEYKEGDLSELDTKKQIRNCLVHGLHSIIIDGELEKNLKSTEKFAVDYDDVYVKLENKYIKTSIPFKEFVKLGFEYGYMYDICSLKTKRVYIVHPDHGSCKTNANVKDMVEYMGAYNMLTDEIESLTDFEKKYLLSYFDFIGLQNVQILSGLPKKLQDSIFDTVLYGPMQQRLSIGCDLNFMLAMSLSISNLITGKGKNPLTNGEYGYESPMIYSNLLLGLGNYCFTHTKEVNDAAVKNGKQFFVYKNIPINESHIESDRPVIEEKTISEADLRTIHEREKRARIFLGNVKNCILGNNSCIPEEKKSDKMKNAKSILESYEDKDNLLNAISSKIQVEGMSKEEIESIFLSLVSSKYTPSSLNANQLIILNAVRTLDSQIELDDFDEELRQMHEKQALGGYAYKDSKEFFRHMRNSIAHGRFTIDYMDVLEKKKGFERIRFTFYDINEEMQEPDGSYHIEFKYTATALELGRIINDFQRTVNEQIPDDISYNRTFFNKKNRENEERE